MIAVAPRRLARRRRGRAGGRATRFFDWLGCVDEIGRSDALRVVLALRDLAIGRRSRCCRHRAAARRGRGCDSIRDLFAGAAWHEREAAELFGVEFVGGDRRRLLLGPDFDGTPLRKDEVLAARTGLTWPGAKEPGETDARRRAGGGWCRPACPTRRCGVTATRRRRRRTRRRSPTSAVGGRVRRRRP